MQMDSKSHQLQLPPHKRFRLFQQQQQQEKEERHRLDAATAVSLSTLPAKKRKESRVSPDRPAAVCLPAKKRVLALPPHFSPDKKKTNKFSPFDLNMEYTPLSVEDSEASADTKDEEKPAIPVENGEIEKGPETTQQGKEGEEDDGIVCAICQSTDGDPSDPIVLCDGCDLMVHASCYGNPLVKGIPEGDWFCAQCSVSRSEETKTKNTFSCCLCPTTGGAMKPTSADGQWAHVVCAVFVPEVFFRDPEGREGIDCSRIPNKRWSRRCYVCKQSSGCALHCSEPKCPLAFHVTCGLKEDLCIEYREGKKKGAIVAGFCKTHSDLWIKQQETGKFRIVAREEDE